MTDSVSRRSKEISPSLRIALLQARDESDATRHEELVSFARRCALPEEAFTALSVVEQPPRFGDLERFDAVMVGGAGEYLVSKRNLPHQERFLELLRDIVAAEKPMFASCFGFQNLVEALGGEVIHAPERTEVGTFALELTEEGTRDPLLGILPVSFSAQMGRKDLARSLPQGIDNLARSERCPHQALRIPGAPIWATQFHPELDETTNRKRFEAYAETYRRAMSPEQFELALDSYRPSPHTEDLLRRFLELVFE